MPRTLLLWGLSLLTVLTASEVPPTNRGRSTSAPTSSPRCRAPVAIRARATARRRARTASASACAATTPTSISSLSPAPRWAAASTGYVRRTACFCSREPAACRIRAAFVLRPGDPAYGMLLRWVAEGCRDAGPSPLAKLEVTPEQRRLPSDAPKQQLTVRAHFKNGEVRDVTDLAVFSVNDADGRDGHRRRSGRVQAHRRGVRPGALPRPVRQRPPDLRSHRSQLRLRRAAAGQRHRRSTSSPGSANCNCCRRRWRPTRSSCAASIST